MDFYPPSYHKNPNEYRRKVIQRWVNRGLIYHNLDELYEVYINTMNCQYCGKEFLNSQNRCLDHDHETGTFRKILCKACNVNDSHLKYPRHYSHKDKVRELYNKKKSIPVPSYLKLDRNKKLNCFFCGVCISKSYITNHYKKGACPMIKPK